MITLTFYFNPKSWDLKPYINASGADVIGLILVGWLFLRVSFCFKFVKGIAEWWIEHDNG